MFANQHVYKISVVVTDMGGLKARYLINPGYPQFQCTCQ